MKKVLVTGGSGYIGSRLCLHLADSGYAVTPVCYPEQPADPNWVAKMANIRTGDIRDGAFIRELAKERYDVIIHLVSLDHRQSEGEPSFVASVNVVPTWSLLDAFSKNGLQKFIYFSTVQVYGRLPNEEITEQYTPRVQNAYGLTHLMGEDVCDLYNRTSQVECRVVRLSNSYGAPVFIENNCWWLVVNDLCQQAYSEKKIVLQSDGTPLRDFIHGWDVCRAVEKIIATERPDPVYHICSGLTLTIWEIACMVQGVYAERYGVEIPVVRNAEGPVAVTNRYHIDNTLLQSIGFEPEWSMERGIGDLFTFLERHDGK